MLNETTNQDERRLQHIKRIAIIGAGPTGIACAKYLLAEKAFDTIDIFEQRNNVGGVWNLSGTKASQAIPIPQTNPYYSTTTCRDGHSTNNSLEFESPLYDYLETNIPKPLMAYSDQPFADHLPLFPKHDDVLQYLEDYAKPVQHLIHFQHQVTNLEPVPRQGETAWRLTSKSLPLDRETTAEYDAVVIANGHYTVPHVPYIPGLAEFNDRFPGVVIHSKAYRKPEDFTGKKVLVVGNSASGMDIAAQISAYAQHPVYLSSRSESHFATGGNGPTWIKDITQIKEFYVDEGRGGINTRNEQWEGFDMIIFATGYFFSYPFLRTGSRSSAGSSRSDSSASSPERPSHIVHGLEDTILPSGLKVMNVYEHFLHIQYPTLAIPVLNLRVIPFPLAQNQAAVIARLWSGRLNVQSTRTMIDWYQNKQAELSRSGRIREPPTKGPGREGSGVWSEQALEGGFHTLSYPEDVAQINNLATWAEKADKRQGLENDGTGKAVVRRDEESAWLRGRFADIKAAYAKYEEERFKITSLNELGEEWIDAYESWSRNADDEEKSRLFRDAAVKGYA